MKNLPIRELSDLLLQEGSIHPPLSDSVVLLDSNEPLISSSGDFLTDEEDEYYYDDFDEEDEEDEWDDEDWGASQDDLDEYSSII